MSVELSVILKSSRNSTLLDSVIGSGLSPLVLGFVAPVAWYQLSCQDNLSFIEEIRIVEPRFQSLMLLLDSDVSLISRPYMDFSLFRPAKLQFHQSLCCLLVLGFWHDLAFWIVRICCDFHSRWRSAYFI